MSRTLVLTAGIICAGLLAAGLAAAGSSGPAARPAPSAGPQPGEPVFVISGRGWGHGVGMSQWGANGFARRGTSYDRILSHYYRGTTIGEAPVAKVRVLLGIGKRALTIASEAPFRVRAASGKVWAIPAGKQALGPGLRVQTKGQAEGQARRPRRVPTGRRAAPPRSALPRHDSRRRPGRAAAGDQRCRPRAVLVRRRSGRSAR